MCAIMLEISELIDHLEPAVRTDLGLLHKVGAVFRIMKQDTVQIINQSGCVLLSCTNSVSQLARDLPSEECRLLQVGDSGIRHGVFNRFPSKKMAR